MQVHESEANSMWAHTAYPHAPATHCHSESIAGRPSTDSRQFLTRISGQIVTLAEAAFVIISCAPIALTRSLCICGAPVHVDGQFAFVPPAYDDVTMRVACRAGSRIKC